MNSRRLYRATLALVAAYALALQALFAAFAPVPLSAMHEALLCLGGAGNDQPVQHEMPCSASCIALAFVTGAPPPPDTMLANTNQPEAIALFASRAEIRPVAIRGPQSSRGPPLA
jgi:hypothetical protein